MLDTFSAALHAIHLSGVKLNDKVAIIGAGPIGLGQLQLAKLCGANVMVTDVVMIDSEFLINSESISGKYHNSIKPLRMVQWLFTRKA